MRHFACEVEPVVTEPILIAEKDFGQLSIPPVAWGETIYVISPGTTGSKLQALSAVDGSPRGGYSVGKGSDVALVVWESQVVLIRTEGIFIYEHRGEQMRVVQSLRGQFTGEPLVHQGMLLIASEGTMKVIDLGKGKIVSSWPSELAGLTLVNPVSNELAWLGLASSSRYVGIFLVGRRMPFSTFITGESRESKQFLGAGKVSAANSTLDGARVYELEGTDNWCVANTGPLREFSQPLEGVILRGDDVLGVAIIGQPALVRGSLYGYDAAKSLIHQRVDGSFYQVVAGAELPPDALPGPVTAAQNVLYLGNWAVDVTTRRVLWTSKIVPKNLAALPLGNARIAYVDGRKLSLYGPKTSADTKVAANTAQELTSPGDGDGVVLLDGRRIRGPVTVNADGAVTVGKPERRFTSSELALIETGGTAKLFGSEEPLFQAWRNSLQHSHRRALAELFNDCLSQRLLDDCRRMVEEHSKFGASAPETKLLNDRLAAVKQSTAANVRAQAERIAGAERELRVASVDRVLAAMNWCAERSWTRAGSALAVLARQIDPADTRARSQTVPWMSKGFPWAGESDAAERWVEWSSSLLSSEGQFIGRDDPLWSQWKGQVWERDSIALRSRNLVLVSRCRDAGIVSRCLRNGEVAFLVLERLLNANPAGRRASNDTERLQVRLHVNREEYLAEQGPAGSQAPAWSAGYYSPRENVSRFFVPEQSAVLQGKRDRELFSVVAHELTHHYLDAVWERNNRGGDRMSPKQAGFWVIEGIARFVEDQVLEFARHGTTFDDETVRSLDASAALEKLDHLLPIADLMNMNNEGFVALSKSTKSVRLQLRNTLLSAEYEDRSIFYDEGGALAFFLMHRTGAEGRGRFVEYLRQVYRGKSNPEGWKALGYESAELLEEKFRAFLAALRGESAK